MLPRVAINSGSLWLTLGGMLSGMAALLHIGCILGGPDWYRFFGAGEPMALAAERGELFPHVITAGIAAMLALWAAYAFSGAGRMRRLPLIRTALIAISAIYLARGLVLFPILLLRPDQADSFTTWSSLIVLAYGVVHAVGTWRAWPALAAKDAIAR